MWNDALVYIQEKVPKQVFETWFTPVVLDRIEETTAYLAVPNKFFGEWLGEHYRDLLAEAVSVAQGGGHLDVSFVVNHKQAPSSSPAQQESGPADTAGRGFVASRSKRGVQLNPKYTFKSFVVGAGNQFAHAACMAVAEQPAKAYNPLFLYGGVGLGKTHLLNAIGNYLAERSDLRIAYLTTEQFTNEVINSIRYDKMIDLRKRYRNVDMLMIDDIQFLAGKERTQEEFFHTFNTLYEAHKQIVLSSDRFPKDMPDIEERLRSRFEWGLIADLQPPDVETRIAILRKKSEDERIALPEDVIHFLATTMKNNIRELEGSLVRVGAYSSLTGQTITLDMAKNVLRDLIGDKKKIVSIEDIQEAVGSKYHLKIADLKSRRRSKTLVHPRQIAMYLCRELTDASFPEIGRQFGGKDHTTIIHACRQITKAKEADSTLHTTLEGLKEQILRA
ncbi:MAG TPA: chromosomal replication initiator protein DnaA [Nitrospira sp.]|jgi:chromosomal replication initiator protein|uniref:chromosomal replication initiator protein DnaA n=1 Tax=Nitrospira sp. ND1 TaxID=1658518 RepID=UPI0009B9DEEA|nr:chromosomal replication initiator protein DnaA [Nitrospira sp. ND1]MBK7418353.1 chromosomal replication initiator protein DnaA [Nitrospira sp.]MDQ1291231.1 chromosomal replication initiator protein [Nitrospirota bacterium]OYT24830.1 MAG: chromosomal replication initiation protein DnaA [Nitrospira sp. UW-LDO-02]MBK7484884.1 chromosomal replication initiator protein DnaA [Nitrospira sp.]MBK8376673.1 chromosomal replication initiator protein DnaA [Nitrospira sp.]